MGQLLLPLIGMGLTAGGSLLEGVQKQQFTQAQIDSEKAAYQRSKQAREAELQRQDSYRQQGGEVFQATRAAVAPDANILARTNAEQKFMDLYDSRGTTQPEGQYLSGQGGTTELIKSEIAKRASTAAADARARVQALAKVGSFDSAMQKSGLALQEGAGSINTLGGLRRGSLNVANQEGNIAPAQVAPGNNLLSPLMQMAGGAVSGMSGTPGGFGGFTMGAGGVPQQNWGLFNGLLGR